MVITMTNDRAIAMLKCAYVAFFVVGGLFIALGGVGAAFEAVRGYPFIVQVIAPLPFIICIGLTAWLMERALKKHMGADAFKAWRTSPRAEKVSIAYVVVMFALLFSWQKAAVMAAVVIALLWVVPALLKKRMAADAFAKFNRTYRWAAYVAVMVAYFTLGDFLNF